jgi:hypothetical protein
LFRREFGEEERDVYKRLSNAPKLTEESFREIYERLEVTCGAGKLTT